MSLQKSSPPPGALPKSSLSPKTPVRFPHQFSGDLLTFLELPGKLKRVQGSGSPGSPSDPTATSPQLFSLSFPLKDLYRPLRSRSVYGAQLIALAGAAASRVVGESLGRATSQTVLITRNKVDFVSSVSGSGGNGGDGGVVSMDGEIEFQVEVVKISGRSGRGIGGMNARTNTGNSNKSTVLCNVKGYCHKELFLQAVVALVVISAETSTSTTKNNSVASTKTNKTSTSTIGTITSTNTTTKKVPLQFDPLTFHRAFPGPLRSLLTSPSTLVHEHPKEHPTDKTTPSTSQTSTYEPESHHSSHHYTMANSEIGKANNYPNPHQKSTNSLFDPSSTPTLRKLFPTAEERVIHYIKNTMLKQTVGELGDADERANTPDMPYYLEQFLKHPCPVGIETRLYNGGGADMVDQSKSKKQNNSILFFKPVQKEFFFAEMQPLLRFQQALISYISDAGILFSAAEAVAARQIEGRKMRSVLNNEGKMIGKLNINENGMKGITKIRSTKTVESSGITRNLKENRNRNTTVLPNRTTSTNNDPSQSLQQESSSSSPALTQPGLVLYNNLSYEQTPFQFWRALDHSIHFHFPTNGSLQQVQDSLSTDSNWISTGYGCGTALCTTDFSISFKPDWLVAECQCHVSVEGRCLASAKIWNLRSGKLIATVGQEGLLKPVDGGVWGVGEEGEGKGKGINHGYYNGSEKADEGWKTGSEGGVRSKL